MPAPFPHFFIPGAPRCGTTSLSSWLSEHPKICFSKPKETFYFSDRSWKQDDEEAWPERLGLFYQHWEPHHEIVGEASVGYLFEDNAIGRILKIRPDARFVVMVRNPLEMAISFHQRMVFVLEEDEPDFEKAWRLQEERAAGRRIPPGGVDPRLLLYGENGRLGAKLERLYSQVPAEQVHVVVFDDFRADPGGVYRGVLDFLGVEDDGRSDFTHHQPSLAYRIRWLQRLMVRPPGVPVDLRKQRTRLAENKNRRRQRRHKKKPLRIRLKKKLRDWNRVQCTPKPLSPAMHEELRKHFAPDVARLGELLGRDLSHWCAPLEGVE